MHAELAVGKADAPAFAPLYLVGGRDRDILEHAIQVIAEQAAKADQLVDEAT